MLRLFALSLICTLGFATAELPSGMSLGVSQEIANALEQKGTAVIFGAPGSGKTEQMQLALQGKAVHVFDLRKEFLSGVKEFSKADYNTLSAKQTQVKWFMDQREALLNQLASSHADVLVFDEIDLSIGQDLNDDELNVVLEIVHMANQLHETGFQVILIIHTSALRNTVFWEAMGSTDVIQTRYLTDEEEDFLLDATILSHSQKWAYKKVAQGLPAAYLFLIDHIFEHGTDKKALYSRDWLIMDANERILKNINVIKSVERPEVFQTLTDLVKAPYSWDDLVEGRLSWENLDPEMLQNLIYTGLVGMKNGHPVIPALVRVLVE